MLCEVGWRTNEYRGTEVGKSRLQFRMGEARIDLPVESLDNFDGRLSGCAHAEPAACLVTRHDFSPRTEIGKDFRADSRGYGQRAKLAASDVLDRRGQRTKHHLHLPGEQIGQGARGTA